jgi:excisionase family DNA binding protein
MSGYDTGGLLTVDEAAERLRVSRGTLYRYVRSGRLEAVRVGELGPWRIPSAALERLLTTTTKGGARR